MNEERELVNKAIDGNEQAIEVLVRRYERMVYAFAYRMVGDMEEAKDITQDIFIRAMRGLKGFRRESSFRTWLYRIAVNVCLNHKRAQRAVEIEIDERVRLNHKDSLTTMIEEERKRSIRDALDSLPPQQRLAITLRAYEGLSLKETAKVMGCSEGAVKTHYHLGIKRLKETLGKKERTNEIHS